MNGRRWQGLVAGILALAGLAGCEALNPVAPSPKPQARPAVLKKPVAPKPPVKAEDSRALAVYYRRVEADLVAQGLLRTDGGGADVPFTQSRLVDTFERVAFYDEYTRGAGLRSASNVPGRLKRWTGPVRIGVEFGASVPVERRVADRNEVGAYAARLARITGHPISTRGTPNFTVIYAGEEDRAELIARVRRLVPGIGEASLNIFRTLPRDIHCFVMAFGGDGDAYDYHRAIALIRDEHPSLLRQSCVHEELAQGLGLANDSPRARPSIFNDDDEFALLTDHDELLLKLLYDPALRPGMTLAEARPIIRERAAELMGGES